MLMNDNTRTELWVTTTTNVDPATATVALSVDTVEYPCAWDAVAVESPTGIWTRRAHTTGIFAGPAVAAGEVAGATVLAAGSHATEVLLRVGGRILARSTGAVVVA